MFRRVALACLVLLGATAARAQPPVVRAVGAVASGTTAISPFLPAGTCSGDLLLMFCETAGSQTIGATGWNASGFGCSQNQTGTSTTTDTRLTVMYRVAATCSPSCTCTDATTTTDSGNHQICRIVGIQTGTYAGNGATGTFDVCANNAQTSNTTSVSITGATSTINDTLVVAATSGAAPGSTGTANFSSFANSSLTSVTEQIDNEVDSAGGAGNGGILGVATGIKDTAGAWGATTATSVDSTIWANAAFNIFPLATRTPTNTPTPTATQTFTNTPTPTNTDTPTAAAGCGYTDFTPAADADDAQISQQGASGSEWPPTSTKTVDTSGTTSVHGRFVFGNTVNSETAVVWDTSALGAAGRGVISAALTVNYTAVAGVSARNVVAEWTTAGNDGWQNTDHVLDVGTTALNFSTAAVPRAGLWSYTLSNAPANVSVAGKTGLIIGVDGGTAVSNQMTLTAEMRENAGTNPPKLRVYWCNNTPTPTRTPTVTNTPTNTATATNTATFTQTATDTATGTQTPSPTMTMLPTHFACPDRDGDGVCRIKLRGNKRLLNAVWPASQWLLPDVAGLCDATVDGTTSPEMADAEETSDGTCDDGSMLRGTDGFADLVIIDVASVYDFVYTTTAPRSGINHGPDTACRVDAINGFVGTHATDVHAKCVGGPMFRTPCIPKPFGTPTPCTGDPAPDDPWGSFCQPWVFADNEAGVRVFPTDATMCQQRTNVQSVFRNVVRMVKAAKARRAIPVLLFNILPANWQNSRNASGVRTTPLPNTTPYPNQPYQAEHEVASGDMRLLRSWAQEYSDGSTDGPLCLIDLQRDAEIDTVGRAWRWLGDQTNLTDHTAVGHCACVQDADCGAGGVCTSNLYCTAGPRATCSGTDDPVCAGSSSQGHPGHSWCGTDAEFSAALAVNAAVEAKMLDQEQSWVDGNRPILRNCADDGIERMPQFIPWPTYTAPASPTQTGTITPTGTVTRTATPTTNADTPTPGGPNTPTSTATSTITETPTPSTPIPFSDLCSAPIHGAGNPKACDKLGTLFRHHRDWSAHIGSIDSHDDFGYALADCTKNGDGECLIHVSLGTAFNAPPYRFTGPVPMPNQLRAGDVDQTPQGGVTNELTRDLGHLGDYKWLYQNECTFDDAFWEWWWEGSPTLRISAGYDPNPNGPTLALPDYCDVSKYFSDTGQVWEWARCHQEVYIVPELLSALDRLRAYGRCSVATTAYYESSATVKPCSGDADCTAIGGGVCNNANNGAYPNGFLTHDCAAKALNLIYNAMTQYVIQNGCVGGELPNNGCLTGGYYHAYSSWDATAMQNACGTGLGTFHLASQGSSTAPPTCPENPTDGGKANLDCKTFFDWTGETINRVLPVIYGCREGGPSHLRPPNLTVPWAPKWCSLRPNKQCITDANCTGGGGVCL